MATLFSIFLRKIKCNFLYFASDFIWKNIHLHICPGDQNLRQTSIRGIIDHFYENNTFPELELGCVPNSTTCSTNSIVELLRDGVGGVELQKREQAVPNTPLYIYIYIYIAIEIS
jgi:hypothetical protein